MTDKDPKRPADSSKKSKLQPDQTIDLDLADLSIEEESLDALVAKRTGSTAPPKAPPPPPANRPATAASATRSTRKPTVQTARKPAVQSAAKTAKRKPVSAAKKTPVSAARKSSASAQKTSATQRPAADPKEKKAATASKASRPAPKSSPKTGTTEPAKATSSERQAKTTSVPAAAQRSAAQQSNPAESSQRSAESKPPVSAEAEKAAPAKKPVARIELVKKRMTPGVETQPAKASAPERVEPEKSALELVKEDSKALIRRCEHELEQQKDRLRSARLHYEIANLCEFPLNDLQQAAKHYQLAHEQKPDHLPTIRGARRVLLVLKRYQDALPLFETEAKLTPEPREKAALYYLRGRLLEDAMGQRQKSRDSYQTALDFAKQDASILKAIERWEHQAGDWEPLFKTYERSVNTIHNDKRHRAALFVQRARLAETRMGDQRLAIEMYELALQMNPNSRDALAALKRLHRSNERWQDLIRVLEHDVNLTRDVTIKALTLHRIAHLHRDRLGNRLDAISAMEQAVINSPTDPLLLEELSAMYHETERFAEEVEILQRLVTLTKDERECLALLHRIGHLSETQLDDITEAVKWYEVALQFSPTDVAAMQALGKLYGKQKNWEAMVRMHLNAATATREVDGQAAAFSRVAEIYEDQMQDKLEAMDYHGRALSLVPGYPASFKALVRLYSEARQFRKLVELYERSIDTTGETDRKVAYLFKIGAVYEDSLGEHGQAAYAYNRILQVDADNLGALHALQRATERAGRYQELVEALEAEAQKTRDTARLVALLHRAGQVLDENLGDRDAALQRYRRVMQLDPSYPPGLKSLGRVYYSAGRWEDLLATYKQQLKVTTDERVAVALLLKMGELCDERIGRDAEAISCYKQALSRDPSYTPAMNRMAKKLAEQEDWKGLVDVLEQQLKQKSRAEERAEMLYRIGELFESRLKHPDRAVQSYNEALQVMPDYRPAFDALIRLRTEQKNWKELVSDLNREAGREDQPDTAEAALLRQGEIWSDYLGDARKAIDAYEQVLDHNEDHLGAMLALEHLYTRANDWKKLAELLYDQANVLTDSSTRIAALRELARLQQQKDLGNIDSIRHTYETILKLDRRDSLALDALEALALETNQLDLLAQVDRRIADLNDDPGLNAASWARRAAVLEILGEDAAMGAYKSALDADSESLAATRGLARMAKLLDEPVTLADALRREAAVTGDPTDSAELLVQSAVVQDQDLDNPLGAIKDLERALEVDPNNRRAAAELTRLLMNRRDIARLADLLSRAAGSASDRDQEIELWLMVAALYAEELANNAGAINVLQKILAKDPKHIEALQQLALLYERSSNWRNAAATLEKLVRIASDKAHQIDARLRLAALNHERLNESQKAIDHLQAVLKIDANHRDALLRLANLLAEADPTTAAALARRLVRASQDAGERAAALFGLFRAEMALGRDNVAIDTLREAVGLEGPQGEAAREYEKWLNANGGWDQYASALQDHLEFAIESGMPAGATYLKLAEVLGQHLDRTEEAADMLKEGLRSTDADPQLRAELATYLRQTGRGEEALSELSKVIGNDVTKTGVWRELARIYKDLKRPREARLALSMLAALGDITGSERKQLAEWAPRPAHARPGTFNGPGLRGIAHPDSHQPAASAVLSAMHEGLYKLYPTSIEAYGLSSRDKIGTGVGNPARDLADKIARVFGIAAFDFYIYLIEDRGVILEPTDPPTILFPAEATDLTESQQTFVLAQTMAYLAQNFWLAHKLSPQDHEVLLAAATRSFDPSFGAGLASEKQLNSLAKRISKSLSRRGRKNLEEVASRHSDARTFDAGAWVRATHWTATRAALLLSDDLPGVISFLLTTEPGLIGRPLDQLLLERTLIHDLLYFWMSEEAMTQRRRCGMLPQGTSSW